MALFGKNKKKKDKGEEKEEDKDKGGEAAAEGGGEAAKEEAKPEAKEGEEGAAAPAGDAAAPKKSKKKLIIIILLVLVLGGAGAGLYFTGMLNSLFEKKKEETAMLLGPDGKPIDKPIFYNLPDFLVNLNSQGKGAAFLKASVILEVVKQTDVPFIEANLPRISDAFTTYLRELRPSDLSGSAGIQRLREELLLRVNKVLTPVKVNDVLFKEIVVQ